MTRNISRDGDSIVIRIPAHDAHALRVALKPCECVANKSAATKDIKTDFIDLLDKALAKAAIWAR